MDLKAQYLSETCSDPIEFLRQLRQTTEPIGGSTIYDKDGELVEYDVAIEAVKKANEALIEKTCSWLQSNGIDYFDGEYWLPDSQVVNDFKTVIKYE